MDASNAAAIALESVPIPQSFKCPITQEIMDDPVVTVDGQVYERTAIQEWFRRGNTSSPLTGMVLPSLALTAETPLKRAISEYLGMRPEIARKQLDILSLQYAAAMLENELQEKNMLLVNPQDGITFSSTSGSGIEVVGMRNVQDERYQVVGMRNVQELYHCTWLSNAENILREQQFRPGSTGLLGPGIYFSKNPSHALRYCQRKTGHGPRVNLRCQVDMGNVCFVDKGIHTAFDLLRGGMDSFQQIGRDNVMIPNMDKNQIVSLSRAW